MKMTVEQQQFNDNTGEWEKTEKTLNLPDELPANVGDKADRKLKAEIDMDSQPNNSRGQGQTVKASTRISSDQFAEVTDYLSSTMIQDFNRGDQVDMDKLTDESKKKVARHYFNQLNPFGSQKKSRDEAEAGVPGGDSDGDR